MYDVGNFLREMAMTESCVTNKLSDKVSYNQLSEILENVQYEATFHVPMSAKALHLFKIDEGYAIPYFDMVRFMDTYRFRTLKEAKELISNTYGINECDIIVFDDTNDKACDNTKIANLISAAGEVNIPIFKSADYNDNDDLYQAIFGEAAELDDDDEDYEAINEEDPEEDYDEEEHGEGCTCPKCMRRREFDDYYDDDDEEEHGEGCTCPKCTGRGEFDVTIPVGESSTSYLSKKCSYKSPDSVNVYQEEFEYFIEAHDLLKYIDANKIDNLKSAILNIAEANGIDDYGKIRILCEANKNKLFSFMNKNKGKKKKKSAINNMYYPDGVPKFVYVKGNRNYYKPTGEVNYTTGNINQYHYDNYHLDFDHIKGTRKIMIDDGKTLYGYYEGNVPVVPNKGYKPKKIK